MSKVLVPNPYVGPQVLRRHKRIARRSGVSPAQTPIVIPTDTLPVLVPATATVFSLVGLGGNPNDYMPNMFYNKFSNFPYTMLHVDYPASMEPGSIPDGVTKLDRAVKGQAGPKIVIGHSEGSQVASRWIQTHRNDTSAPPASELTFLLTGNPLRATGGWGIGRPEFDGTIGVPTPLDSPWPVVDFSIRWDGWADPHQITLSNWVNQNTISGKALNHQANKYWSTTFDDPTHTIWRIANTTFILTYEQTPPVISSWSLTGDQGDAVRSAFRRHVEKGYNNRPETDRPNAVSPALNAFWVYMLSVMGVDYS